MLFPLLWEIIGNVSKHKHIKETVCKNNCDPWQFYLSYYWNEIKNRKSLKFLPWVKCILYLGKQKKSWHIFICHVLKTLLVPMECFSIKHNAYLKISVHLDLCFQVRARKLRQNELLPLNPPVELSLYHSTGAETMTSIPPQTTTLLRLFSFPSLASDLNCWGC